VIVRVEPGERCDRAVLAALRAEGLDVTRAQLQRAFAQGGVTSEGRALEAGKKLARALEVAVVLPAPTPLSAAPEPLPLDVVYEDPELLVVDKPAGMVVHASVGHARGTLVGAVLHHLGVEADTLPVLAGNDAVRPGIVHRIDKDTSGLLVVGKTARAQEVLASQFRTHAIERSYLGIVLGVPEWTRKRIETLHGRDPADRRRMSPTHGRRRAVTDATVEQALHGAALVRFVLHTGRTHQIRMHARHLGHPIVGDALYGHRIRDERVRAAATALGRHALHAATLGFVHPDGSTRRFVSPLPPDMQAVVDALAR
jgi:23S rRNA pseudouridine1911/1915/1917 synthase